MDAVTASLVRSPVLPPRTSDNGSGSMFLTASGPGFTRSGSSRLQIRLRVCPKSLVLDSINLVL